MHLDGKEGALAFAQSLQPTLCTPCTCERITYKSIRYKYTYTYTVKRQFKVYAPCTFTLCIVQVQASFCAIATHILHFLYYLHNLQNSCEHSSFLDFAQLQQFP